MVAYVDHRQQFSKSEISGSLYVSLTCTRDLRFYLLHADWRPAWPWCGCDERALVSGDRCPGPLDLFGTRTQSCDERDLTASRQSRFCLKISLVLVIPPFVSPQCTSLTGKSLFSRTMSFRCALVSLFVCMGSSCKKSCHRAHLCKVLLCPCHK